MSKFARTAWALLTLAAAVYVALWWVVRPFYHWLDDQLGLGYYVLYVFVGGVALIAVLSVGYGLQYLGSAFAREVRRAP